MALWFFDKVVWFALAAMLDGILLPSNMAAKTNFCLYLVKKEVIHNIKNHILVTWPSTNLLILRKWYGLEKSLAPRVGFEKPDHYYFV